MKIKRKFKFFLSTIIALAFVGIMQAQDWSDGKNGIDFNIVKPKYISKENCKRILISSFNIGYVINARGEKKVVRMDTEITGITPSDLQKITNDIYDQFVAKWKAAGYEVVNKEEVMKSQVLAKGISKGEISAGGSGKPAFSIQFGNSKLGETFFADYYVPTGVPNYGEAKVPMMNPGKISKEFNAIVLNINFVFNTIDFKRSESHSTYSLTSSSTFEVNAAALFSTSSGGAGSANTNMNTGVTINYTSPKGFISTGSSSIKQFVSAEKKFFKEVKQSTEDRKAYKFAKRDYVSSPELFGNESKSWIGGFMDVFIERMNTTLGS
jgi:hypothetical protein